MSSGFGGSVYRVSYSLNSLMGFYRALYRGLLWGILRGILGVQIIAHMAIR